MTSPQAPVLRATGLKKTFGSIVAVDGIDLELHPGEVLGFLGPNGSGKSTTIGMVLGLIAPTSGQVELFGRPLPQCGRAEFRRVGAVLENQPLYPFLSGRDNLEVQARLGQADRGHIEELLDLVGLRDRADSKAHTYSQGMKQRLALAAALLTNPDFLLLDEPTNGLDPSGMLEVRALIKRLGNEGKAVLLSSHLLHEVEQVSTRVAIIKKGKVLAQGPVDVLLRQRRVLQLRVPQPEEAAKVLQGLPWIKSARVEDGLLLVETPSDQATEVSAALAGKGIFPSEMKVREESLESFFQEVTQGDTIGKGAR